jgi:hypothetical protein
MSGREKVGREASQDTLYLVQWETKYGKQYNFLTILEDYILSRGETNV